MNMVRHQAIGQDVQTVLLAIMLQESQIEPPIVIVEKHNRATITSLGDMVRQSGCNYSRYSRHAFIIKNICKNVKSVACMYLVGYRINNVLS